MANGTKKTGKQITVTDGQERNFLLSWFAKQSASGKLAALLLRELTLLDTTDEGMAALAEEISGKYEKELLPRLDSAHSMTGSAQNTLATGILIGLRLRG